MIKDNSNANLRLLFDIFLFTNLVIMSVSFHLEYLLVFCHSIFMFLVRDSEIAPTDLLLPPVKDPIVRPYNIRKWHHQIAQTGLKLASYQRFLLIHELSEARFLLPFLSDIRRHLC